MKHKVSVIIPCYNQGKWLSKTLESVYSQSYENWECLIINDGSPDNTNEIAKSWTTKDTRFKLYQKKNGGLSSARNFGLDLATGEFILFLDSDDLLCNDKLLLSINSFESNKTDIVVTNFIHLIGSKISPPFCQLEQSLMTLENILLKWDKEFSIPIHCGVFKKKVIGETRFNETLKAGEDWVFWIDIFKKNPDVIYINQEQVYYRLHSEGITRNPKLMIESKRLAHIHIFKNLDDNLKTRYFDRYSYQTLLLYEQGRIKYEKRKIKNIVKRLFGLKKSY